MFGPSPSPHHPPAAPSSCPHLRRDGSAELADEGELVLLRVALHDGAAGPHLGHDAAPAPQVNGGPVVPLPYGEAPR